MSWQGTLLPDKRMQQAALRENILADAEIIGTPRGLRALFPSNLVRVRVRAIHPPAKE